MEPLAEQTSNWSRYIYAFNNSVRLIDPTGMMPEKEFPDSYKGTLGKGDWRKSDRENKISVWQKANGSNEYVDLDQRADFIDGFSQPTDEKVFQTKWVDAVAYNKLSPASVKILNSNLS
ncbi:hypothetical protein GNY06_05185 [Elizabethkingia argentiflava]|uniref:RHS repeat-associated core domain-containing protein n=1 Tax=Elizabethkingia argenteiflava TaxID=2681556 RepID=A0A845PRG9_9FLAO|nr:hypothetical protein [Elizabethkingia argenteiflava]NAW50802.1 hypothetical protein [Elizabethkingia argenteiflava]